MKTYATLTFLLLLCSIQLIAHKGILSGTVNDEKTGEPLVGATLYIKEMFTGTTTDIFGNYKLQLNPGTYTVETSFIGYGYQSHSVTIREHETTTLAIRLAQGSVQLSDIIVTSGQTDQGFATISSLDIKLRPINNSQDILRMVPGLFIAQHAGGGKAEQIFLRGFDIDHGTDIHLTVDGMPVNMVSHAHGQGYSDLHFLIPETISRVEFDKGPYNADKGDFATAGYAAFKTFDRLESNSVKIEGGDFGTFRTVALLKLFNRTKENKEQQLYAATEFFRTDGYFESPQDFHRFNGMLKYYHRLDANNIIRAGASTFTSQWNASGQIPERAVASGLISRFGAIDDTEGGNTKRTNVWINHTSKIRDGIFDQQAYASLYDFYLVSNFTFFLRDPERGDQITQDERRRIFGYNASYTKDYMLHNARLTSSTGVGFRHDNVDDVNLSHTQNRSIIIEDFARGNVRQSNGYLFTDHSLHLSHIVTVQAALRYDYFNFGYQDILAGETDYATVGKGIVSPKFSVTVDVTPRTSLYIKSGYGFHSNDSRVITAERGRDILPKAFGVDVGTKWKPAKNILLQAAAWMLDLEQEFVYVGDEGIVEPSGATLRKGVDLSLRYQVTPRLFIDTDFNFTSPRTKEEEEGKYIPLAPTMTSIGGLTYKASRFNGSVRYRYLGDRPANADNSLIADGYTLLDALATYSVKRFTFSLSVENLLNKVWKEAQFETESQLQGEAEPVSEIHYTPGVPRFVKAGLVITF